MSEPITTAIGFTGVKASAQMGVSMGLFGTAVIFTDPAYMWMSIIGAFMGVASTFHTIFSQKDVKFTRIQISAEMLKGFVLGVASMPIAFLAISQGVVGKLLGVELGEVSLSLSLVAAFVFSWYATTVLDKIVKGKISGGKDD